jgi:hypothetical protein
MKCDTNGHFKDLLPVKDASKSMKRSPQKSEAFISCQNVFVSPHFTFRFTDLLGLFLGKALQVNIGTRGDIFVLSEDERHELQRLNREWLLANGPKALECATPNFDTGSPAT